jgi:cysteinyl-tRNA synthetase
MAGKYLGDVFDIHGGGLDLVFPHHENEIAQSKAAGQEFARYWMHNGWVTMSGEKMSKSLGNSLLVSEVVKRVRPVDLRFFLASPHYRSMVEYSEASLAEAATAYGRIETFVRNATDLVGDVTPNQVPPAFVDAMNDDLGTPQALAVVYNAVRDGNTAIASGDKEAVLARVSEVRAMLAVLGLDPVAWASGTSDLTGVVDGLVALALEQRAAARERKDYAAADAIRDRLRAAGVVIEDTPNGPRWTVGAPNSAG